MFTDNTIDVDDICEINYYDTAFLLTGSNVSTKWAELHEALQSIRDIQDNCGNDLNCYAKGCRWSVIFELCGITLLMIMINSIIQGVGAFSIHFRGLGSCLGCLLCCTNFAAIVTTAIFRFNAYGSLAAESIMA